MYVRDMDGWAGLDCAVQTTVVRNGRGVSMGERERGRERVENRGGLDGFSGRIQVQRLDPTLQSRVWKLYSIHGGNNHSPGTGDVIKSRVNN